MDEYEKRMSEIGCKLTSSCANEAAPNGCGGTSELAVISTKVKGLIGQSDMSAGFTMGESVVIAKGNATVTESGKPLSYLTNKTSDNYIEIKGE